MKKIFTKWWFYLILFFVTLSVPIIINEAYKQGKGYLTLWEAKDVLSFYGSYLSFIGTIALGIVAIYQNKKAHQLNAEMQRLQQAQFVSMISVESLKLDKRSAGEAAYSLNLKKPEIIDLTMKNFKSSRFYHIDVEFKNSSQFPIVQILVCVGSKNNANSILLGIEKFKESTIYIPENGRTLVRFIVPCEAFQTMKDYQLRLNICFINIFDYKTEGIVYLPDLENEGKRNEYKYRLAKFTDVKP